MYCLNQAVCCCHLQISVLSVACPLQAHFETNLVQFLLGKSNVPSSERQMFAAESSGGTDWLVDGSRVWDNGEGACSVG